MDDFSDLISTPLTLDIVRGALELEQTSRGVLPHRLPAWARQYADGQLAMAEAQPSGVRLAFRSRATYVRVETVPTKQVYVGAPARPHGVYELVVDGRRTARALATGGDTLTMDMATGVADVTPGEAAVIEFRGLPGDDKEVEVWLPWNERTELVALRTDAAVEPLSGRTRPVWLHHGSSISHGSNADGPTSTWPALAAALGGVDLVNLGFGGSALLDPFVGRVIRDAGADLISVKIGINLVNTDLMRLRAFVPAVHGFLDSIREGHPHTPLLVLSPIACPIHEDTPGPSEMDVAGLAQGRLRFRAAGDQPRLRAASSRSGSSGTSSHASCSCGRQTTRTSATSTVSSSTAPQTLQNGPFQTTCTRTPRPSGTSAIGSHDWCSRARGCSAAQVADAAACVAAGFTTSRRGDPRRWSRRPTGRGTTGDVAAASRSAHVDQCRRAFPQTVDD